MSASWEMSWFSLGHLQWLQTFLQNDNGWSRAGQFDDRAGGEGWPGVEKKT